jgi:PAS domain S-box-containing protein
MESLVQNNRFDLGSPHDRALRFKQAALEGVVFHVDGFIIDCNTAFETILGHPPGALIGQHVLDQFAKTEHSLVLRHLHSGPSIPILIKLMHTNGSNVDVQIISRTWAEGGHVCSVSNVQAIASLDSTTRSLIRSQVRYRALVEHADQVILFDQNHHVTYANPAAMRFFKMGVDALHTTPSLHLIHPDDRSLALSRRKEMISGDPDHSVHIRTISPPSEHLQPDTVVSWVRFYGSLVEWEGKAATLIFMTDLTAQRAVQERMQSALSQEKALGDLKTRFVSMASHEFRTPLATIQTSSELLQHYSERLSAHEKAEAIADIQRSVQRMQAMMENFLAFGRLSSDALHCTPAPVAVLHTVRSMVYEALVADAHQHAIEVYAQSPIDDNTELQLDALLLEQMLGNLLSNACKYSAFGQRIDVLIDRVAVVQPAAELWQLRMVVVDRGIGVPAADVPLLFESFHRASNAGNVSGTGLGLAIVDRAVRSHGGRVRVHSVQGEGAQFELLLPWMDKGL